LAEKKGGKRRWENHHDGVPDAGHGTMRKRQSSFARHDFRQNKLCMNDLGELD